MKTTNSLFILILCFAFLPERARAQSATPPDPLLIFSLEVENFVSDAQKLSPASTEKEIEPAMQAASRVARIYFFEASDDDREKIQTYMANRLNSTRLSNAARLILGNAFALNANRIAADRIDQERKLSKRWLAGGLAVGVLAGGTIVYARLKSTQQVFTLRQIGLHAGIFVGSAVAGAGLGYASAKIHLWNLPFDLNFKNARDFLERYPSGEDFLKDIGVENRDLQLLGGL